MLFGRVMKFWDKFIKKDNCVCQASAKDLSQAKTSSHLKVECLCGEEGICNRLREMGFCEAAVIEKVSDSGSLICKVCDSKVILSKELAQKIIVKDICQCQGHVATLVKGIVPLSAMAVGQRGILEPYRFEESERLEEMGLTLKETIEIIRYAPLGDPIEIKVRGYLLSLRKQEADQIKVQII